MQIATITTLTTRPDFSRIDFARVDRRGYDGTLTTGGTKGFPSPLGDKAGYGSFTDAVTAAKQLTAGRAAGAAVFASSERFWLNRVYIRSSWDGSVARYDAIGSHGERGIRFDRPDVKAVVDGDVVIFAGQPGETVPVTP